MAKKNKIMETKIWLTSSFAERSVPFRSAMLISYKIYEKFSENAPEYFIKISQNYSTISVLHVPDRKDELVALVRNYIIDNHLFLHDDDDDYFDADISNYVMSFTHSFEKKNTTYACWVAYPDPSVVVYDQKAHQKITDYNEHEKKKFEDKSKYEAKLQHFIEKITTNKVIIGKPEFKELINETWNVYQEICEIYKDDDDNEKRNTVVDRIIKRQSILLSIDDGCGSSFCAFSVSEMYSLMFNVECPLYEYKLTKNETPNHFTIDDIIRFITEADNNLVRVILLDIRELITEVNSQKFRDLLRTIDENRNKVTVIFRIPYVDKTTLNKVEKAINDMLFVRTATVPPLDKETMKRFAYNNMVNNDFAVDNAIWDTFFNRIEMERADSRFYGVKTVLKIAYELMYNKLLNSHSNSSNNKKINQNDAKSLLTTTFEEQPKVGIEQLDNMVGMEAVKARVQEIIAQILFAKKNDMKDRPAIHMQFLGNPGTGKTTVARIIGTILKENGVLTVGDFFERKALDMIGYYLGETPAKTTNICRDAYGSILFIDEAYSLFRSGKQSSSNAYGQEAIDTLIAEMENHRDDFVVIFAGYEKEMKHFLKSNPGLKSRIPYTIEFPNYTREQLYEIFVSMVKKKFKYTDELLDAAKKYFLNLDDSILNSPNFANARFARNLFERTWAKAALRCQLTNTTDVMLLKEDFDHASMEKDFQPEPITEPTAKPTSTRTKKSL